MNPIGLPTLHDSQRGSPSNSQGTIRVGLTERHGMAHEQSLFPAPGVQYSFLAARRAPFRFIRSPIKGYLRHFEAEEVDLVEAVLSPVVTKSRWIYSLDCFQAAVAFTFLGLPLPLQLRVAWIKRLFLQDNFKKLVFWSH